jgi:hypothetical protein
MAAWVKGDKLTLKLRDGRWVTVPFDKQWSLQSKAGRDALRVAEELASKKKPLKKKAA